MKFNYLIDFSEKEQKYVHINLDIDLGKYDSQELTLMLPAWSPGSYLIREYSRFLDCFKILNPSPEISFEKISKNQWKLNFSENIRKIELKYRLYCNEFSVRTNFVDDQHALLVSTATFLIPSDTSLCNDYQVEISLPSDWSEISTGLEPVAGADNKFYSNNTEDFLDSPIECGNYPKYSFEAFGKKHHLAMVGPKVYDSDKLVSDVKKVVEETAKVLGDIPYEHYTFITHLTSNTNGGIEHKNSTVLHFNRWDFNNPERYKRVWLSLVSHEYFHLWNVKRIRPAEFCNFDYNTENYSKMLWFSEGFTSYYDDLIIKRAGIYSDEEYLDVLSYVIERLLTLPGRFYQSLEEASFDAWIKFYRKHENINNQCISYYVKGAHLALALDFEIRMQTNHQHSLDDLMRLLWKDYQNNPNQGFNREIIINYAEKLSGIPMKEWFEAFLNGTAEIDYNKFLNYAGLQLNVFNFGKSSLNMDIKEENSLLICSSVHDQGSAYKAGIMTGDEIIAMDDYRVNKQTFTKRLRFSRPGQKVRLLISRDERILEKEVLISASESDAFKIEKISAPKPEQLEFFNKWLHKH